MVYKLGRRVKFYKLRHLRFKLPLTLGLAGTLAAGIVVLIVTSDVPQVVGLSRWHTHRAGRHNGSGNSDNSQGTGTGGTGAAGGDQSAGGTTADDPSQTPTTPGLRATSCSGFPAKTPGLANASNTELRKLAQYQQACNGQLAGRLSFFAPTPANTSQAADYANDMVASLRSFSQYGIAPLVFFEPDTATGDMLDLNQYRNGAYDAALDAYFAAIKSAGITDAMMGTWVMLPEGNIPVWTSVDPDTFAADVTKVAQFQKKYFPGSQTSIMLDSQTYPSAASWSGGAYLSLLPYVQSIPGGLIDSFGLQGFPWASPANAPGGVTVYDPAAYLRVDLAAAAAHSLGISDIWLNTGTFSQMYASNASQTVTLQPTDRQAQLDGVIAEVASLQSQGFNVSVHLFAQDKSATSEGIDWSYWQTPGDSANTSVFTTFVHDLSARGAALWLFDTY
jgi:hypothetical protein